MNNAGWPSDDILNDILNGNDPYLHGVDMTATYDTHGFLGYQMTDQEYFDHYQRTREYDHRNMAKPDNDYDDFFKNADEYIQKREKDTPPEVEEKFGKVMQEERNRFWPRQGNEYIENQEEYCRELKLKLIERSSIGTMSPWGMNNNDFVPLDLLPLHDAVFVEDEPVPNPELKTDLPPIQRKWWDHDVLKEEFGDKKWDVDGRVEEYLKNIEEKS